MIPQFALRRSLIFVLLLLSLLVPAASKSLRAQDPMPQRIESDASAVQRMGDWSSQLAPQASDGSYLYNASAEAVLSLNFSGPSLEIIYVSGPTLGTLAIEVDGTVLRTVITTDAETRYGQVAKIDYLTDEPHELKVYAQGGGVIAVDAFGVAPIEPSAADTIALLDDASGPRNLPCNPATLLEHVAPLVAYGISDDGRYIGTLRHVQGDAQIWLYDRATCTETMLTSINVGQSDENSVVYIHGFVMSGNARYFGFRSYRGVFFVGPFAQTTTLVIYDRMTNQVTSPVLGGSSGVNYQSSLIGNFSSDGQVWAMMYGMWLAVRNQTTGGVQPLLVADSLPITPSGNSVISADGRYLAFTSTQNNLVADDTNNVADVFWYDWHTEAIQRVSVSSMGEQGNAASAAGLLDISGDGRYVTFVAEASNLVPDDTNGVADLFVRDTQTSTTTRISVGPNGEQNHNGSFGEPHISADGRYISFQSSTAFWTPNDTNGFQDVFVYDQQTGTITRVSSPGNGTQPNEDSYGSIISDVSREVAFWSEATNLVPSGETGIFVGAIPTTGDKLALFRPDLNAVGLVSNLTDLPSPSSYMIVTMPPPATGQWVMGDWDSDGTKTPGVYGDNGVFYYANTTTATATWSAVWVGLLGRPPVAGRFEAGVNHDCIGAVDSANFPPYGTAFAFYFTCDLTPDTAPPLAFQWLSVILPDAGGFSGTHQFAAGDFDNDGVDSIAIRRGEFIAFGNVPPTTLLSEFNLAQYWGVPPVTAGDYGVFLTGDFDNGAGDSFGVHYHNGNFYYRNAVDWAPGPHTLQQVGQPMGTPVQATSWR